ncbi:MAG: hypothetical protein QNK04_24005 [Myxococcota bacterium]|nr:hypothetical protein [Myxococcota bacterium]
MPELSFAPAPPRDELLRQLRHRLAEALPDLRWVAEGVLGEGATIDFVGVGRDGQTTLVLVGEAGEDLPLVARALAQRAWLEPRLRDWRQLGSELGIRPEAGVALVLLCPAFASESRAAARALGGAAPALFTYCCVRNGSGVEPLLDPPAAPDPAPAGPRRSDPPDRPAGGPHAPVGGAEPGDRAPSGPPEAARQPFRTGLTDADLEIDFEERREFE